MSSTLKRRLRDVGDRRVVGERQRRDLRLVLHEVGRPVDLAERALDLRMAGMADQDQRASAGDVVPPLIVHLGDERAGRVERRQAALARLVRRPRAKRHAR